MNLSTFGFILGGVLLNAAAQLALKAGVRPLGALSLDGPTLLPTLWRVFTQGPVVLGLGFYLASVVLWLVALSRVDVSLAYPMLSLGYVVNALAAWWLFGEALGPGHVAGMVLILGIHRFMGTGLAMTNLVGNGVATLVVSAWEKELDRKKLAQELGCKA